MILPKSDLLPSFFINSVPKSGTNLIIQILSGLPGVSHDPTHTFFDPQDFEGSFYRLGKIGDNQFGVGHIYYSDEWSNMLKRLGMKQIFILRDLRDVVISLSHFVVEKPQFHHMDELYKYLTTETNSEKERLLALIKGVRTEKFLYPNLAEWFKPFKEWLHDSNTLCITFENLVRTPESGRQTLEQIVRFLWEGVRLPLPISQMVKLMEANIDPLHCGTFRKGEIGSWKTEFDEEIKAAFKEVVGTTLMSLEYEMDNNW